MNHLFRECPISLKIWEKLYFSDYLKASDVDFREWLTWVFEQATSSQCRLFCCTLWAIWGERNKCIHERANKSGEEITEFIKNYILKLNGTVEETTKIQSEVSRWKPPPRQFVKINFDAAYNDSFCQAAVGVVARDGKGSVLLSCSAIQNRVASTFTTGAIVCSIAIRIGVDMQWGNIIIEGDALTASNILTTETLKKKREFYLIGNIPKYTENQKAKEMREEQTGNEV
ncbi:Zinc finger, CCHC-type [Gossypium australe]|uniref:Zinc finger, CCHC-type n=1 Tax=Gossypium australe TaxID=47621 RepID=A0A5B6V8C3_9ROSI|nr:Zinc finger, CCHC-type [Gossypium australe]